MQILIANLFPAVLRFNVERLVTVTRRHVKDNDTALYDLIVESAANQHNKHQMQAEVSVVPPNKDEELITRLEAGYSGLQFSREFTCDDAPDGKRLPGVLDGVQRPRVL